MSKTRKVEKSQSDVSHRYLLRSLGATTKPEVKAEEKKAIIQVKPIEEIIDKDELEKISKIKAFLLHPDVAGKEFQLTKSPLPYSQRGWSRPSFDLKFRGVKLDFEQFKCEYNEASNISGKTNIPGKTKYKFAANLLKSFDSARRFADYIDILSADVTTEFNLYLLGVQRDLAKDKLPIPSLKCMLLIPDLEAELKKGKKGFCVSEKMRDENIQLIADIKQSLAIMLCSAIYNCPYDVEDPVEKVRDLLNSGADCNVYPKDWYYHSIGAISPFDDAVNKGMVKSALEMAKSKGCDDARSMWEAESKVLLKR